MTNESMKKLVMLILYMSHFIPFAQRDILSTNGTALSKYADIPVSNYTGIPTISIPLYTIKSGDLTLPIHLSYHGSGIKVSEESSNIGLGWVLNAGGVITREIRGIDDFKNEFQKKGWIQHGGSFFSSQGWVFHLPVVTDKNLPQLPMSTLDEEYYKKVKDGEIDSEPDIFRFNFMGYTGKFVIKDNHSPPSKSQVYEFKTSNLVFQYDHSMDNSVWKVVDGNGTSYFFETSIKDQLISLSSKEPYDYSSQIDPLTAEANSFYVKSHDREINSWYLTKIISAQGEAIDITYSTEAYLGQLEKVENYKNVEDSRLQNTDGFIATNIPERDNIMYDHTEYGTPYNRQVFDSLKALGETAAYAAFYLKKKDAVLKKISFKNGKILFSRSKRSDLQKWTSLSAPYQLPNAHAPFKITGFSVYDLDSITSDVIGYSSTNGTIYETKGKEIKRVAFYQSYFDESEGSYFSRLRLDSIQEFYNASKKESYKFLYEQMYGDEGEEVDELPSKLSYQMDHWGYPNHKNLNEYYRRGYNAIRNPQLYEIDTLAALPIIAGSNMSEHSDYTQPTLLPFYMNNTNKQLVYLDGIDREPHPFGVQLGILKKVKYPNGKVLKLNYEPNEYSSNASNLYIYEDHEFTTKNSYIGRQAETPSFFLEGTTVIKLNLTINLYNPPPPEQIYNDRTEAYIGTRFLLERNGIPVFEMRPELDIRNTNINKYTHHSSILLPKGNYTVRTYNLDTDKDNYLDLQAKLSFKTKEPTINKIGAGVRIQSLEITNREETKTLLKTVYSYEDSSGVSTGKLLNPLKYAYNRDLINQTEKITEEIYNNWLANADRITRTVTPVTPLSNGGVIVGYDRVTTTAIDSLGNSAGSTVFSYINDVATPNENFLPGIPNYTNPLNGSLIHLTHYNENGIKVQEETTHYTIVDSLTHYTKGMRIHDFLTLEEISNDAPEDYAIHYYDRPSKWIYIDSIQTTTYDSNGNNPTTSTTVLEYSNYEHKYPTKITQSSSLNSDIITTKNNYYLDEKEALGVGENKLMSSTIPLNTLITQKKYSNEKLLSTTKNTFYPKNTEFCSWNGNIGCFYIGEVLASVQSSKDSIQSSDIEKDEMFVYTAYNSNKMPIESIDNRGIKTFYLRGYNDTRLLAKLENFGIEDISGDLEALFETAIDISNNEFDNCSAPNCTEEQLRQTMDSIRNSSSLEASVFVESYTYDPLIGMTSFTDARGKTIYYQYGKYNQLQYTKDEQGNILSRYETHYKNN